MYPACCRLFSVFDWCRLGDSHAQRSPLQQGMGAYDGGRAGHFLSPGSLLDVGCMGFQGCFMEGRGQRWALWLGRECGLYSPPPPDGRGAQRARLTLVSCGDTFGSRILTAFQASSHGILKTVPERCAVRTGKLRHGRRNELPRLQNQQPDAQPILVTVPESTEQSCQPSGDGYLLIPT